MSSLSLIFTSIQGYVGYNPAFVGVINNYVVFRLTIGSPDVKQAVVGGNLADAETGGKPEAVFSALRVLFVSVCFLIQFA
ncbi:MAG: hypothetical protein MR368_01460 [Azospirillum sp.]|nr:hypothetical protein [Azospirillum sp.]